MSLPAIAIERSKLTNFIVFLLVVGGLLSYSQLGRLEDPPPAPDPTAHPWTPAKRPNPSKPTPRHDHGSVPEDGRIPHRHPTRPRQNARGLIGRLIPHSDVSQNPNAAIFSGFTILSRPATIFPIVIFGFVVTCF